MRWERRWRRCYERRRRERPRHKRRRRRRAGERISTGKGAFHRAEIYAIKELGGVDREGVVKVDQADESRVGLIDAFEVEMAERATAPMY